MIHHTAATRPSKVSPNWKCHADLKAAVVWGQKGEVGEEFYRVLGESAQLVSS